MVSYRLFSVSGFMEGWDWCNLLYYFLVWSLELKCMLGPGGKVNGFKIHQSSAFF